MESSHKRWEAAQNYEKNWWDLRKNKIDFKFYENFARELTDFIKDEMTITSETVILEIGSGAGGIITSLKASRHRHAIDPLEEFYASVKDFRGQRDKSVKYYSAVGESIPFDNDMFDLIIMDNVLDHCQDPALVIKEVSRVLKPGGLVYFKQNTYHFWGFFVRKVMESLLIDKGHPHTFLKNKLKGLFRSQMLQIKKAERKGYFTTWKKELTSGTAKDLFKAVLFVTRDKVTWLMSK